jgi:DNA-damage-inducible protein J
MQEVCMPMSVLQIRIEEDLKKQVSDLFESLGMDIPTAVRIFFKRALVENGIPFEVKGMPSPTKQDGLNLLAALHEAQRQAHEHGVDNLSEEEIEAEIKAARAERKKRFGTNG